ncbi:MAG: Gfo/Idh/MocA family oxidoreductase [Magnetovibrio sp.]|nr:Gfo/Idh/MocA family oxidoreductase [Magnetovibrio sp.]
MTTSNNAGSDLFDVVIIGCGRIAGGIEEARLDDGVAPVSHAGAYRAHPNFRVVACIEPDEKRRQEFMSYWDVPHGFADLASFVDSGVQVDVASVCSPNAFHIEHLKALLPLELKGVFCEKPLAETAKRAVEIAQAYERAGVPLLVHYLRRWVPEIATLKQDIDSGAWGDLLNVVAYYSKGLKHNGSHVVDLLTYFFGKLTPLYALSALVDHDPNDPSISAVLKTPDNKMVHLLTGDERQFQHIEASFLFTGGRVDMENLGRTFRFRKRAPDKAIPGIMTISETKRVHPDTPAAINDAVENLYQCILGKSELNGDGASAVDALQTCEAISDLWKVRDGAAH